MTLSEDQENNKKKLESDSLISATIVALIASAITYFLTRKYGVIIQITIILIVFIIIQAVVKAIIFSFSSSSMKCEKCNAEFSVTCVDRDEELLSAIPRKREREIGRTVSGKDEGKRIIEIDRWVDERYKVTEITECVNCGDRIVRKFNITKKVDSTTDKVHRR